MRGLIILATALLPLALIAKTEFVVDTSQRGNIIGNKSSNMNLWNALNIGPVDKSEGMDLNGIVDYIHIMQAGGGEAHRELFKDPLNKSITDDYDFAKLTKACSQIVANGMKPYIKFSVPIKFSKNAKPGIFNANYYPPDDYDVYYKFIDAICKELVEKFGRDELMKWRYGLLTEFDNKDWFIARDGKPETTKREFCKLYDYTMDAVQKNIGENVFVGAHAMQVGEPFWKASDFLEHCAKGKNYKTGKIGTRINFITISYYDVSPEKEGKPSLARAVEPLQKKAEELGLNLIYGVDEGRILNGRRGKSSKEISSRVVADSFQAAHDARFIKMAADSNIDYFSEWTLSAGDPFGSYPLVSYHVAKAAANFKNSKRVQISKSESGKIESETEALAGYDENKKEFCLMAYNFKRQLQYTDLTQAKFTLKLTMFAGKTVKLVKTIVDDSSGNFYPEFLKDKEKYDVLDNFFEWSPDTASIDNKARYSKEGLPFFENIYLPKLRAKYVKLAQLKPRKTVIEIAGDGTLNLSHKFKGNGVVFYKISE